MNHAEDASFTRAASILLLTALSSCAPNADAPAAPQQSASYTRYVEQTQPEDRDWFVYSLPPPAQATVADRFGFDVAVSGDTAVVTAPGAAAAYVFVLAEHGWQEPDKLEPPSDASQRFFGASVAILGDTVVVGAPPRRDPFPTVPGLAYIYVRSGSTWGAPTTLAVDDGLPEDAFGSSVAISDDTIVVGAHYAATGVDQFGSEGAAYVFTRSGRQTKKLFAQDGQGGGLFGAAVAISGSTLLVGSPGAPTGNMQGSAYVFTRSDGEWKDGSSLVLPDVLNSQFGSSVAIAGDLAVVGARFHNGRGFGIQQGAAFVYTRSGSEWQLSSDRLLADDAADLDAFGNSVALSQDRVMVGAPGYGSNVPDAANSVYLFAPLTGSLVEDRIGSRGEIQYFGGSVDWDGDIATVGSLEGLNGAYTAEFRTIDGSACDEHLDCASRYCVDGVCCQEACSGACETCATGVCTPLPQGSETSECGPYLCAETGGDCPTSCIADSQCTSTHNCRDGECVLRLANGERCTRSRDCKSGFCVDDECAGTFEIGEACSDAFDCKTGHCVDGVCCDLPCDAQCEACDVRGARGTCRPVRGAPHGDRASCDSDGSVCGGECNERNSAACAYPTSSESCGTSCADGATTESVCNGQGACEIGTPRSCGRYLCDADGTECRTDCDSSEDCAEGFTCADEQCQLGATCLDESTVEGSDGSLESCGRYRCHEGSCLRSCTVHGDCANDSVCDRNHECVSAPRTTSARNEESGGCSVPQRRTSKSAWMLWVLVIAGVRFARLSRHKPASARRSTAPAGRPKRNRRA